MSRRHGALIRIATQAFLLSFVGLPILNASGTLGLDEPVGMGGESSAVTKPAPTRRPVKPRKGWVKKAVLPKPATVALGLQPKRKPADLPGPKSWEEAPAAPRLTAATRLEYCAEFTKPAAICIHLQGTPKNHRSPPA
jgi:hypothetical protein